MSIGTVENCQTAYGSLTAGARTPYSATQRKFPRFLLDRFHQEREQ